MILYSLSALEMVAVESNQPATLQNVNKHIRGALKLSKSTSAELSTLSNHSRKKHTEDLFTHFAVSEL